MRTAVCVPPTITGFVCRYVYRYQPREMYYVASDSKGGINTCAIARDEFGLGALSSYAASQSRPSTIRGVSG